MRALEILCLAAGACALFAARRFRPPVPRPPVWAGPLLLGLVGLHLAVDGPRWQMGPGYLAGVGTAVFLGWPGVMFRGPWLEIGCGLLIAASTVLGWALPVFDLPTPTGPYPVGTTTRYLTDGSRTEPRGDRPGEPRPVVVQFWYPGSRSEKGVPYRMRSETTWVDAHLPLVRTHAADSTPVHTAAGRCPVVVYSPSWPGRRGQNTVQFEELASRGFIVAAVDHPFGSQQVALPGGRVARTTLGGFLSGDTVAEVRNSLRQVESEVAVRVADIRFVLDELERLDGNDPAGLFTGRLDIGRAGALGYSFGGAVAAEASSQDSRLKAVVNLDGMLFGRAAAGGIACPYLLVTGSLPEPAAGGPPVAPAATADEERDRILAADTAAEWRTLTTHGGSLLTVRGAVHLSLSAGAFHTPLRRGCGPLAAVPPSRVMRLLNDFTADFFSSTLVPSGPGPAAGPAVYPEAQLRTWPRPVAGPKPAGPALLSTPDPVDKPNGRP